MTKSLKRMLARRKFMQGAGLAAISAFWTD